MTDFDEYIRQSEPCRQERAYTWQTAIGLQAVDGLKPSDYLKDTARRHIEGKITIDEAQSAVKSYYQSKNNRSPRDAEAYEADQASAHIAKILSTRTLDFSPKGYIALHRRIFDGIFKCAGKIRDYDISKKEWVLDGDSVSYLNWEDLRRALDYDIEQERQFSYAGLSPDALTSHITGFVSSLWQIHPFGEGNTRTTAVFIIQYLRSLGFDDVSNNLFANHAWYFRNALVRANYKNALKGIDYTPVYLERFFRNLLLKEQWDLRNRYLHIHPTEAWREQPCHSTFNESPIPYGTITSGRLRTSTGQVADSGQVQTAKANQVQDKHRTSTGQAQTTKTNQTQDKHRTSTGQAQTTKTNQTQDKYRT
ncbi:MAG: Fic family protein, partial [Bacteroidales bacterium]|nr:Fic family protein [Bacteroidales bacterium]